MNPRARVFDTIGTSLQIALTANLPIGLCVPELNKEHISVVTELHQSTKKYGLLQWWGSSFLLSPFQIMPRSEDSKNPEREAAVCVFSFFLCREGGGGGGRKHATATDPRIKLSLYTYNVIA